MNIDFLFQNFIKNLLSYHYILEQEFQEVNDLINELKKYEPFKLDVREATPTQNALNIAVIISYARNFKKNYGFYSIEEINAQLKQNFSEVENALHKKIITERDKEFAHSDASINDIKIYSEGPFSHSGRTLRQLLEKKDLIILQNMISKIREEINDQINNINN